MKKKVILNRIKAQTSVFIIVAVIVVAVIIGVYYLNQGKTQSNIQKVFSSLGITAQASVIESSILNCVEEVSEDSLTVIGIQGGYYNNPGNSFDLGWAFIPYYYDKGDFLMPKTETIEKELSDYVKDNLGICLENIETEEFEMKFKDSKTTSNIKENKVEFEIDLTITMTKGDLSSEFELENHPITVNSKLFEILEVATYITDSHREDPEMICINCVADMAEIRDLYIDMVDFGAEESTTLNIISENVSSGETYIFEFLNRYPV